jgi:MFS family permease
MGTGGYLAVIIVGSWVGYIVSAYLNDAIGRRKNFLIFAIGSLIIAVAYTQAEIPNSLMLVLGFPLGFFASGIFSGMGPVLTELFPTSVRGAGQGFCYNFGRGIGAFFPDSGRYTVRFGAAGHRHRHLRCVRLCRGHPRRIDAARDPCPEAAGELSRHAAYERTA